MTLGIQLLRHFNNIILYTISSFVIKIYSFYTHLLYISSHLPHNSFPTLVYIISKIYGYSLGYMYGFILWSFANICEALWSSQKLYKVLWSFEKLYKTLWNLHGLLLIESLYFVHSFSYTLYSIFHFFLYFLYFPLLSLSLSLFLLKHLSLSLSLSLFLPVHHTFISPSW